MTRCRAVLFDMDDTLYPERRFALSGFRAVAHEVERRVDVPAREVFAELRRALSDGARAAAFQRVCGRFALDPTIVPDLVRVLRTHPARLRLPREAERLLVRLRSRFRLAIVTNGPVEMQRNKVEALGLRRLVDEVIYAVEHGGVGKPDAAPFLAALDRLDVEVDRAVHVGDDPERDVAGGRAVGLKTVRVRWLTRDRFQPTPEDEADEVVDRLDEVPAALDRLCGGDDAV